jgi:putative nucleotidyltransferase with HDIG domain
MAASPSKMIDQLLDQIEHLPTLPQVVTNLLAMTESPSVDAVKLSRAMDQSLAAKVLKVANSAYYGRRKVNSIQHGIAIIGFDAVKEIILTTSLFHTFHESQDVQSLQPLWQHSLECAVIAKRLAWIYRYETLDEAYFAGLIHDIGKLIIQQYFSEAYKEIENATDGGDENLNAEKDILGLTHAEIGGKMAQRWDFPPPLVDVVTHHHDQDWRLNPKLGRILYFADRFVLGFIDFSSILRAFKEAGISHPGSWNSEDLQEVEEILRGEIDKAHAIFNISGEVGN